jgi:hypothetical protein
VEHLHQWKIEAKETGTRETFGAEQLIQMDFTDQPLPKSFGIVATISYL